MYQYTYKFKTTEQLWNCDNCPLFNDEYGRCNELWQYPPDQLSRYNPRMPECPLEEVDLNIIDMEVPDE